MDQKQGENTQPPIYSFDYPNGFGLTTAISYAVDNSGSWTGGPRVSLGWTTATGATCTISTYNPEPTSADSGSWQLANQIAAIPNSITMSGNYEAPQNYTLTPCGVNIVQLAAVSQDESSFSFAQGNLMTLYVYSLAPSESGLYECSIYYYANGYGDPITYDLSDPIYTPIGLPVSANSNGLEVIFEAGPIPMVLTTQQTTAPGASIAVNKASYGDDNFGPQCGCVSPDGTTFLVGGSNVNTNAPMLSVFAVSYENGAATLTHSGNITFDSVKGGGVVGFVGIGEDGTYALGIGNSAPLVPYGFDPTTETLTMFQSFYGFPQNYYAMCMTTDGKFVIGIPEMDAGQSSNSVNFFTASKGQISAWNAKGDAQGFSFCFDPNSDINVTTDNKWVVLTGYIDQYLDAFGGTGTFPNSSSPAQFFLPMSGGLLTYPNTDLNTRQLTITNAPVNGATDQSLSVVVSGCRGFFAIQIVADPPPYPNSYQCATVPVIPESLPLPIFQMGGQVLLVGYSGYAGVP